ncbi:hypothetical protein [Serratia fonticola]
MNAFKGAWELAFQKSPILLSEGIASGIPGGVLPISVLTDGISIVNGLLSGANVNAELLSTNFQPAAGSTLIYQDVATYPFLNQAVAGNATVKKPNRVIMNMIRPATTTNGGYIEKPVTFTAMKLSLERHNDAGGTYTILTPAFIYTGCLMRSLTDMSGFSDQVKQPQYEWQFEFEQPLLYQSQLDIVMGNLMSKFDEEIASPAGNVWSSIKQAISTNFPSL